MGLKNPLALFAKRGQSERMKNLKDRVLKNREAVLDAFAETVKGARGCPDLMGSKCIGSLCEKFLKFTTTDEKGKVQEFHRCADIQTPLLIIELRDEVSKLVALSNQTNALLVELIQLKKKELGINEE